MSCGPLTTRPDAVKKAARLAVYEATVMRMNMSQPTFRMREEVLVVHSKSSLPNSSETAW